MSNDKVGVAMMLMILGVGWIIVASICSTRFDYYIYSIPLIIGIMHIVYPLYKIIKKDSSISSRQ